MAPARIDVAALRAHAVAVPPMFTDLINAPTRRQVDDSLAAAKSKSALAHRLHGLPEAEQHAVVLDLVRSHIATVLGTVTPEAIDPDKAFQELGFDSLTAVEMRNRLKAATGLALSPTLIFDYPTPIGLANYIRTELAGVPQEIKQTPAVRATGDDTIAIVAMSCRYPGGVESPEDLWDMLVAGSRRTLRVSHRPRLGAGRPVQPRPRRRGNVLHPHRRLRRRCRGLRPRVLRYRAERGAGDGPAATLIPRAVLGSIGARRD